MRAVSRGAAALAALALLAACQPLPRPFAPAERSGRAPVVPAEDAYGVTLRPVSGMAPALAARFAAALVAALDRRGVPAVLSAGRARGSLVHGAAQARPLDGERLEVAIEWWAIGRAGRGLGRHRVTAQPARRDWRAASAPLVERLAAESADGIAALLRGAAPGRESRKPAIRVGSLAVPPGLDGGILRRATVDAMRAAGLAVSPGGPGGLLLTATVSLGPPADGRRRLRVEWRLDDAGGRRLGALVQENRVARETLTADWPSTVRLIARAAVGELGGLLARAGDAPAPPVDGSAHPP